MGLSLQKYVEAIEWLSPVDIRGRVNEVTGLLVRASVPGATIGELCLIRAPHHTEVLRAEVIGFRGRDAILMPLGDIHTISMGAEVIPTGSSQGVRVGEALLGRILNGLGEPMDGKGPIECVQEYPVRASPPNPLQRQRISRVFATGVKAIDGALTIGEGQRVGVFSGAGIGKSTLLGMLAQNSESDVNVIALVGERGREVRDFLEENLGEEGLRRSVVVVATSNEPSLVRLKAAYVATAIAEFFRDQHKRVLLLLDSITRFARALREVGLAAGEPPTRVGFPPSVFSELPKLLERTGNSLSGSITAFYTILVEGDDLTEPIADETSSILDGHIVLDRALAANGHFPPIDINRSVSRSMPYVTDLPQIEASQKLRSVLATYEEQRDLLLIGAYKKGSDSRTDYALEKIAVCHAFLQQKSKEKFAFDDSKKALNQIFS